MNPVLLDISKLLVFENVPKYSRIFRQCSSHWNPNAKISTGTAITQTRYTDVRGSHSDIITNCSFHRESLLRSGSSKTT